VNRAASAIGLGTLLLALAYASAWSAHGTPAWGVVSMIAGCATTLTAMLWLGATRAGARRSRVIAASIFLFVVLLAGFGLPLLLPAETAQSPLFLGLPWRAAIEIYGVGLSPLLVLPVIFAAEFSDRGLDRESLERLRLRAAALRNHQDGVRR
jgi:hypothetical protein